MAPGCTALLSADPACRNPHPHLQSRGSGLQTPWVVPTEPGVLGGWGADLSWPEGLCPAACPDAVSGGACCCGSVSHQLLHFLSRPTENERVQKLVAPSVCWSAPSHWRKQQSQRVHGRLSLGKMQRGREKHTEQEMRERRVRRQGDRQFSPLDAGRWIKKKHISWFFLGF